MKKSIILTFTAILLSSCGASIHSIVDHNAIIKPFENPLVVIPYENYKAFTFSNMLKNKVESKFQTEGQKVEILFLEQQNQSLSLNANDSFEDKINYAIIDDDKDIVIIFRPTNLRYLDGRLQSISYEIVGIETVTFKEVWKANLSSSSSLGPSLFADKCAELVYNKLKIDGVL